MTTAEELGFVKPVGTDLISTGDNDISANADAAAAMFDDLVAKRWAGTALAANSTLKDLTEPGPHYANTSSIAATILDRPAGATTEPFEVDVSALSITNGVYVQRFKQYGPAGPTYYERQSLNGVYAGWDTPSYSWARTALKANANLSAIFTPGTASANTSAIAATIGGRPEGATTQPFEVETKAISINNGVYYQKMTQWSATGPTHFERESLAKVYANWEPIVYPRWTHGAGVHFFGDSLVANGFPNYLTGLTGPVVNRGRGGDTSNDVLLRAGIIRVYATPVGGSIPASGPVSIDLHGRELATRDGRTFAVIWAGVLGTLTHVAAESWTFTRNTPGAAVAIAKPAQFVSTQAAPSNVVLGFFFGTNDVWHGGFAPDPDLTTHIVSNYQRAIESVTPFPERHVLVFGMITSRSTTSGSPLENLVKEVNAYCASTSPHLYVSMQEYMVNQAMTDLGMTPTPEDSSAVTAGLIPPSLYADDLHLIQPAQEAFALNRVKTNIQARGWA